MNTIKMQASTLEKPPFAVPLTVSMLADLED